MTNYLVASTGRGIYEWYFDFREARERALGEVGASRLTHIGRGHYVARGHGRELHVMSERQAVLNGYAKW